MEITLELIVFIILAIFICVNAILAATTKRILRAATYLLFVLFGTAVLYVFSILLTSSEGDKAPELKGYKFVAGLIATVLSLGVCLWVMLRHDFLPQHFEHGELNVRMIGHALMSADKYGYVLPFEVISVLLLACIVGGIMIARKR